jgi:hypothetical protein
MDTLTNPGRMYLLGRQKRLQSELLSYYSVVNINLNMGMTVRCKAWRYWSDLGIKRTWHSKALISK